MEGNRFFRKTRRSDTGTLCGDFQEDQRSITEKDATYMVFPDERDVHKKNAEAPPKGEASTRRGN